MTNHTTPLNLDDIETRANAATPGPWCTDSWEIYQGTEYEPGLSMWIGETCRGTTSLEQDRADAEFVAAARTDVPELLAEVRRLRAELADQRAETQKLIRWHGEDETALKKMRGTVERLRAKLAAPRTLTESEHNAAWHAIEGAAGEDMADPGTVLNAVLHALGITPPATPVVSGAADSRPA